MPIAMAPRRGCVRVTAFTSRLVPTKIIQPGCLSLSSILGFLQNNTEYITIQNLISSLPVPVPGNGQRTTDKSVYHYISN